jgi:hypothetical protein
MLSASRVYMHILCILAAVMMVCCCCMCSSQRDGPGSCMVAAWQLHGITCSAATAPAVSPTLSPLRMTTIRQAHHQAYSQGARLQMGLPMLGRWKDDYLCSLQHEHRNLFVAGVGLEVHAWQTMYQLLL